MIDTGDTAWLITATALVLFMTLPGLALFYGGLVRAENLLSVLMQCFAIACLVSVVWLIGAYSLAFSGSGEWIGDLNKALLSGVARDAVAANTTIPETVFFTFQMTFAIITPALMVGAFVERLRFDALLLFTLLWVLLVYVPVTHWVWGGGWLAQMGVLDYAGGIVVHLIAGVSALVVAIVLGPRLGFPDDVRPPHAPWMSMVGACMLWVGWFGFNAGSALKAGGDAGMAMTVTQISAATATLVWIVIEWAKYGKPSMVGAATGAIAGLATITPASGFVGPGAALVIGIAGGTICYYMVGVIKRRFKNRRCPRRVCRPWRRRCDRHHAHGSVHRRDAWRHRARRGPQHGRPGNNSAHRDRRHFAMVGVGKLRHHQGRADVRGAARRR